MAAWLQALSRNVREVRLHLCQTSKSSNGVRYVKCHDFLALVQAVYCQNAMYTIDHFREFIQQHYVQVKQSNPRLPFLIRECSGVEPRLYARYGEKKKAMY